MSQIISLIKYDYKNERLYEDNSEIIETTFISEDCIQIINESLGISKVYEEFDSDEFYEIDCIGNFEKNIKLYEDKFIELIKNKKIENISESIDLFRTLTNVHHIFWLKNEKFLDDNHVIIKLG